MDGMAQSRRARALDARSELDARHEALFWSKVDASSGPDSCWTWTAATAVNGYGVFGVLRKGDGRWRNHQHKAHRLAWSLTNGPIEDGLVIRHSCDNPPCCNPAHLLIGTGFDNVADKVERGRQAAGDRHAEVMARVHARGERSANAKLTEQVVREMRERHAAGESTQSLADHFAVSRITAYRVVARKSWRHVA